MYRISNKMIEEINFTTRILNEIVGEDIECEGLIVSDGGNAGRRSYLIPQQAGHAECLAHSIEDAFKDIYNGNRRIVGAWHSHGVHDVFHSCYDDIHLAKTIIPLVKKYNGLFKEEDSTLEGKMIESWKGDYILDQNVKSAKKYLDDKVLSLVVNARGNIYAKCFEDYCESVINPRIISDPRKIEYKTIIEDVGNKIMYNNRLIKDFPNYDDVLKRYSFRYNRLQKVMAKNLQNKLENIINGKEKGSSTWDDRAQAVSKIYDQLWNKENVHEGIKRIIKTMEKKTYAKKHRKNHYDDIMEKLSTLKYRSLFKVVRRQRFQKNSNPSKKLLKGETGTQA